MSRAAQEREVVFGTLSEQTLPQPSRAREGSLNP
jgi:hypothetical protein